MMIAIEDLTATIMAIEAVAAVGVAAGGECIVAKCAASAVRRST